MSRTRKLLIVFACWTFVSVFFAAHITLGSRALGERNVSFWNVLAVYMTCAYTWFLFTPFVVRLSQRFRLASPNIVSSTAVHVLASIGFMFLSFTIFILVTPYTVDAAMGKRAFFERMKLLLAYEMHLDLLRYWGVVAIEHTLSYHRQAREREVATSQLRAELAEARLEVLKRQLQPHFLFNTLNSISMLMFENVQLANRMLLRLSELLRAGLTTDSPHEVSLEHELSFLERYLDIERMRFGDRLTIDVEVDPSTLGARVPNLLLQPLVENAIRYGVAAVDRPSTVAIRAEKTGSELRLQVRDDGPGLAKNAKRGVGLSNTEARLKQLYGSEQRMELTTPNNGGVLVSIAIPFRAAAVSH
ncbi:MAG TPA: histidine kinase [Thermoanaerobaculia bacterium]|nr:histidine kinase [Thermoanaerobaculia bacterium]